MYKICIPTYNRKDLLCLELLKDPTIELNLFVRQEALDEGFYDFLKNHKRVNLISLGRDVKDIGDTRERILQHCVDENVDYCVMLDDGVYDLYIQRDEFSRDNQHKVIEELIHAIEHRPNGLPCAGGGFRKDDALFADGVRKKINFGITCRNMLGFTPTQAIILNVKVCKEYDLHYKTLDVVGFEDCAFYVDALKKGLVFVTPWNCCFGAVVPNSTKSGGNHSLNENVEHKYDKQAYTCREYLGDIYGIGMSKRYRSYANAFLTMVEVDNDFFWEVLVKNRKINAKIIDSNFKIVR